MQEWLTELGYSLGKQLEAHLASGSLASLFVVYLGGLVTSFTPCVYPMIPVTVTYIGGAADGNRRRAVSLSAVYVLGMAVIYAALGIVTALGGKTFGQFTRSVWIYGAVSLVILLFGLMMLDVITLRVPAFVSRVQHAGAHRGGHFGAALMGVAAGFVAAPCTAPVLGLLLVYVAQEGNVVWGGLLLMIFALGLGTLLLFLGIFSGMIASLPRAGVWMNWVKKIFGYGMLLVAAWFLWQTIQIARS